MKRAMQVIFGCDNLAWNYVYNRLSVVSVCTADLVFYSSEVVLCGESRHMVSPGFGNTISNYLCTLRVVSVYITDLVFCRFVEPM